MSIKWPKWYTTIDPYGKIHFPEDAREYLNCIEKKYNIWDEKFVFISGKEKGERRINSVDLDGERGYCTEGMVKISKETFAYYKKYGKRGLYMLGAIHQKEKTGGLKKGKYLLFCPLLSIGEALCPVSTGLRWTKETSFFKGALTLFDKYNRVYVPSDFQKIAGIDSYKNLLERKNIVIRTVWGRLPEGRGHPPYGYWLEIWNRKDLEK